MINCVVIDDEPLAREGIISYIKNIDFLNYLGSGTTPMDLSPYQEKNRVDLLFLDIQMPIMNGIDFLKSSSNHPLVILTTAYPNYAIDSYDVDVVDYLLKPITFNRFFKAVVKAKEKIALASSNANPNLKIETTTSDYFFVKCNGKFEKIIIDEILYIQSLQNYVTIYTSNKKYVTLLSLKAVFENLDDTKFLIVHRSYVVSLSKINTIENHEITINEYKIPLSRNYRKNVLECVVKNNLWKKSE